MDISRRDLFKVGGKLLVLASVGATLEQITGAEPAGDAYRMADHWWGMIVDIDLCIGCGNCVRACSRENNVPHGYFRTWVERYQIEEGKQPRVDSPDGAMEGFPPNTRERLKSFFVPKLCNQCAHPPCVQVCPVGATFQTKDGVVLVDEKRCIGCRYCIQACPYGARYLNPHTKTADKCTFCYHRVTKGLQPACVEVCPTEARIFGDLNKLSDRLVRFQRANDISVLKPDLNTDPKVRYAKLDGEVR